MIAKGHAVSVSSFQNYNFWERTINDETINMINSREKYIVVIDKKYTENIEKLEKTGITIYEYGRYKIIKNY